MGRRGPGAIAIALALAAAGCGGGDGKREDEEPAVRCTPSSEAKRKVVFRPRWKAGDQRTVVVQRSQKGPDIEDVETTWTARIHVLRAGPKGASLRWTAPEPQLPLQGERSDPDLTEEVRRDAGPVTIEYTTDRLGALGEVRNQADLEALAARIVARIGAAAPSTEPAPDPAMLRQIEALVAQNLVAGVDELHSPYGLEIEPNEPLEAEYEASNLFLGSPVRSTTRFELVTDRDEAGCALLEATTRPDPDALAESIGRLASDLGAGALPSDLRVRTEARYRYDPGSGWVVWAEVDEIVTGDDLEATARTVVTTR